MPSLTTREVVPLPSDLPAAELQIISAKGLIEGSKIDSDKLWQAGTKDGFFYLDLTDPAFEKLLDDVDTLFSASQKTFDMDLESKMRFDVDKLSPLKLNGYKPKGRNIGAKDGLRDGFESYALPRNGILNLNTEPFARPPSIDAALPPLQSFITSCTSLAQVIFARLSSALQFQHPHTFEQTNRPTHPSPDVLRLLKYHASSEVARVPQTPHTDLGSLTFLFALSPGLQVLRPDGRAGEWVYVSPRPRHAVINLGDAMTMLSGGLLHSCLHRVGPLPGRAMDERYSLAFLMRPEDQTVLAPIPSPLVEQRTIADRAAMTSGEWIKRKFGVLRGSAGADKEGDWVLTGRETAVRT